MAHGDPRDKGTPQDQFWGRAIDGWKNKAKHERAAWNKLAAMYRTMANPRGEGQNGLDIEDALNVESNWIFAFADTLAANVVPTNPAVTIKANRAKNDDQAKLRTHLVNTLFDKEGMQRKLWQMTTRASVWPRCFLKCVWQHDLDRPILRVIKPHNIFFDITAETEADMKYIIEVTVITRKEFESRLKKRGKKGWYRADAAEDVDFGNWPKWLEPDDEYAARGSTDTEVSLVRDSYEWTVIYEVYDLVGKNFYHYADGVPRSLTGTLELPYKFISNPYKMLTFNDNLQDLGGMSDAELIAPNVERINEMDTLQMTHLKTTIPSSVIHSGLLDDPGDFLDAFLTVDGPGQPIELRARPNVKITDVLGVTPMPSMPVEWAAARRDLESTIQFVVGLPSYARGEVGQSDVATELALTDTATRTRNARRQKAVYDVMEWTAGAILALYQQFMDPESEIPVRVMDTEDEKLLTKELLQFGDDADDTWGWDYKAHPYTAAEQNEIVQLKQLEQLLPTLQLGIESGAIDGRKFFKKMLELLHMPEILADAPPAQAAMPQQPGMPPGPGGAGPGGEGVPMAPGAAQAPMQGGEVMAGSGAQAVPGGLEGGRQGN